jgi:hypothetical protein
MEGTRAGKEVKPAVESAGFEEGRGKNKARSRGVSGLPSCLRRSEARGVPSPGHADAADTAGRGIQGDAMEHRAPLEVRLPFNKPEVSGCQASKCVLCNAVGGGCVGSSSGLRSVRVVPGLASGCCSRRSQAAVMPAKLVLAKAGSGPPQTAGCGKQPFAGKYEDVGRPTARKAPRDSRLRGKDESGAFRHRLRLLRQPLLRE